MIDLHIIFDKVIVETALTQQHKKLHKQHFAAGNCVNIVILALRHLVNDALLEHPDNGELVAAVVTAASPRQISVAFIDGSSATIEGDNLRFASSALSANAQPNRRIRPGAIVRVVKNDDGKWAITQLPQVEGAFISIVPQIVRDALRAPSATPVRAPKPVSYLRKRLS